MLRVLRLGFGFKTLRFESVIFTLSEVYIGLGPESTLAGKFVCAGGGGKFPG